MSKLNPHVDPTLTNITISLSCDRCGTERDGTIADLTPDSVLVCPVCGTEKTMEDSFLQNLLRWFSRNSQTSACNT